MVDAAQGQEQKAKDTIEQLKMELAEMSKLVVDKGSLGVGQDYRCVINISTLAKTRLSRWNSS